MREKIPWHLLLCKCKILGRREFSQFPFKKKRTPASVAATLKFFSREPSPGFWLPTVAAGKCSCTPARRPTGSSSLQNHFPQQMPRQPKAFVGKAVCGDFRDPLRFAVWQVLAPDANRLGNVADVFSTADLPRRGRARVVTPAGHNFWFVEKRGGAGDANPYFTVERVFHIA